MGDYLSEKEMHVLHLTKPVRCCRSPSHHPAKRLLHGIGNGVHECSIEVDGRKDQHALRSVRLAK